MLFNSIPFIFYFLPVIVLSYYLASLISPRMSAFVLLVGSFVFYAYWDVSNLPILAISVAFNFVIGSLILRTKRIGERRRERWLLTLGVALNLGFLSYYKYLPF